MAIIYSYPEKLTAAGGDFLVITDSEQTAPNKNRTKSLKIDTLADYIVTSTSGIIWGRKNTSKLLKLAYKAYDEPLVKNPHS